MTDRNSTANTNRTTAGKLRSIAGNPGGSTESTPPQLQRAVTARYDFFNATTEGGKLFSVNAGVPLCDAFEQLSLLLAASQSVMEDVRIAVSAGEEPHSPWAAVHLSDFTYALVQAMHGGLIANEAGTLIKSRLAAL